MPNSGYTQRLLEGRSCPCCECKEANFWASENGFNIVRCVVCALLYVNPRPKSEKIDQAVREGKHILASTQINVRSRRVSKKVQIYRALILRMFADFWRNKAPITWVDIGSGYGEILQAVSTLAAPKSSVIGIEPMVHKADEAKKLGLTVYNSYLQPSQFKADVISIINVFSHVPDFDLFLKTVATNLVSKGEILIETGNLAELRFREDFPGELGVPDHLVFAGESQLCSYLNKAGFDVVSVERERVDGFTNFLKNIVKKVLGRPVLLSIPYTSDYRQIMIRARLR